MELVASLRNIADEAYALAVDAMDRYEAAVQRMSEDPTTIDELHALQSWLRSLMGQGQGAEQLRTQIRHCRGVVRILETHGVAPWSRTRSTPLLLPKVPV